MFKIDQWPLRQASKDVPSLMTLKKLIHRHGVAKVEFQENLEKQQQAIDEKKRKKTYLEK